MAMVIRGIAIEFDTISIGQSHHGKRKQNTKVGHRYDPK